MSRKKSIERRYSKWGYIFVVPFLIIFLVFQLWPLMGTIYDSFCYLKHAGNTNPEFLPAIGQPLLKNFIEVLKAKSFQVGLKNTLFFFIASVIPEWILAFWLAAVMTDRKLKLKGRFIFKTAFFFPKIVQGTTVSGGIMFRVLEVTMTSAGFLTTAFMLNGFGIMPEDMEFLYSVKFLIIVLTIFLHFGIVFIYAVAGITGISVEIFESAEIDGATRLQTFFNITLPCMKPMLFFITVISVIDGIGMNEVPSMFGQFDTTMKNLTVMMYLRNQAFAGSYAYDKAAAASVILLIIYALIAGTVYFFLLRDKDEEKLRKIKRQELKEMKARV